LVALWGAAFGFGCSGGESSSQVLTGRIDATGVVAVRAVSGSDVVTAAQVNSDGTFRLALPAGSRYRLEVLGADGVKEVVAHAGGTWKGLEFGVCVPKDPFELGTIGNSNDMNCDPMEPGCKPCGDGPTDPPPMCNDPMDPNCGCKPDGTCPPPPCMDPMDPNCQPPPSCGGPNEPPCPNCMDPMDPNCGCKPDGTCPPPPCPNPMDPSCQPPSCGGANEPPCPCMDPTDPNCGQPSCGGMNEPPCPCMNPMDPSCGTGGGGGCMPGDPDCSNCEDPMDPTTCKDPCVIDPMQCGCTMNEPNCWPPPEPPTCDPNTMCDPGGTMTPTNVPGDFGCATAFGAK
jgi:hypothetical protein